DAVPAEILTFGHNPDTDHVIVLGYVPEPALFGDHSDGSSPGIDPGIPEGTAIIGPHRNLVQFGIAHSPTASHSRESLFARAIQRDARVIFFWSTFLVM